MREEEEMKERERGGERWERRWDEVATDKRVPPEDSASQLPHVGASETVWEIDLQ